MIPASFDYSSPTTLSEAIALLKEHPDASLIPLMKLRMAAPKHLIDVNGIRELSYIRKSDGVLTIGALTRESDIDASDLIRETQDAHDPAPRRDSTLIEHQTGFVRPLAPQHLRA